MATNTLLKLKKSSVAGRIPDSADLAYGELAINYTDGKLWYKHSADGVKAFLDSSNSVTVVESYLNKGNITINADVVKNTNNFKFDDNTKLIVGTDSDLLVWHDGQVTSIDNRSNRLNIYGDAVYVFHGDSDRMYTTVSGTSFTKDVSIANDLSVGGSFTTITTDGLNEGSSNLYYTKTRTDSDISALVDSDYVLARTAVTDLVDSEYVANLIDVATFTNYTYQPDSDATVFQDSDINGNVLAYDPGFIDVFLNGTRLTPTLDYTATNGTSITLLGDGVGNGNTIDITGRQRVNLFAGFDSLVDSAVATTTQTSVDKFLMSQYRSAKYVVQLGQGGNYQVSELLVIHDGTSVYTTEYATVQTDGSLGTIEATTDGTTIHINVTPTTANTDVKIKRLRIDA